MTNLLSTRALVKSFGENRAVGGVDFNVVQGQVLALIGSNGAGKTTLVNLVSGLLPPDSGQIIFENNDAAVTVTELAHARHNGTCQS